MNTGRRCELGAWVALLSGAFCAACDSDAGGPRLERVALRVAAGGEVTGTACTRVPVMLGSYIQNNVDVAGRFSVVVFTSRTKVDVSLENASFSDGSSKTLEIKDLNSSSMTTFVVTDDSGAEYELSIHLGCEL